MAPSLLGHHDHTALIRDFKGIARCNVALCLTLRSDPRPIAKGLTAKTRAQLSKMSLGLEPLLPSVEGAGAAEEQGLAGVPGMALGQQEDDVGAEPEFGIGVLAVDLEQFVALLGRQGGHRSRVEIVRGGRSM